MKTYLGKSIEQTRSAVEIDKQKIPLQELKSYLSDLDEISIASKTKVVELREDKISEFVISPEEFGLALQPLDELKVNSPQESLSMAKKALNGEHLAASSMVALNAGAALYVSGVEKSLAEGVERALEGIKQEKGLDKLQELSEYSQSF